METSRSETVCEEELAVGSPRMASAVEGDGSHTPSGTCTCPDGHVYMAADRGNACRAWTTLQTMNDTGNFNCFGGVEGPCQQHQGRWAFREVHCAPAAPRAPSSNAVVENDFTAGSFGGTCTCPDGQVYLVGDNTDQCGSLACAARWTTRLACARGGAGGFPLPTHRFSGPLHVPVPNIR